MLYMLRFRDRRRQPYHFLELIRQMGDAAVIALIEYLRQVEFAGRNELLHPVNPALNNALLDDAALLPRKQIGSAGASRLS